MFSIQKEFTKKVKSILTGAEAVRTGNYKLPQFGPEVPEAELAAKKFDANEALAAFNEALNYFGSDGLVRFLNNAVVVKAQKRANNDLRSASSGLNALDQALVETLLRNAKQQAEIECQTADENGKLITIDRKSEAYTTAFRESLEFSLTRPKVAHLRPVFADVTASTTDFDLTAPGKLTGDEAEEAPEAE